MPDIAGHSPAPNPTNTATNNNPNAQPVIGPFIALVVVFDSSTALGQSFSRFFNDYFIYFAKRLNESHPSLKLKLAFVTYGPADYYPNPIMTRNVFLDCAMVINKLRESPDSVSIGATNYNPQVGMATLDGLVAALELFDDLEGSDYHRVKGQSCVHHILHVSASQPSDTPNPVWNDRPSFDSVTWATLPDEFKKRNIALSSIALGTQIPQITALQSVCNEGRMPTPWFNVISKDHVLLSSAIVVPMSPLKGAKRPADAEPPSPESKRTRISGPEVSPSLTKSSPTPIPTSPKKVEVPPKTEPSDPPPSIMPQPSTVPLPPHIQSLPQQHQNMIHTILARGKQFTARIAQLDTELQIAQQTKNLELFERLRAEKTAILGRVAMLRDNYNKLASLKLPSTGGQLAPQPQPQPGPPSQGGEGVQSMPSTEAVVPNVTAPTVVTQQPQVAPPVPNIAPNQHPSTQPSPSNVQPSASYPPKDSSLHSQQNMAAQMQKLLEQQRKSSGSVDMAGFTGMPAAGSPTFGQPVPSQPSFENTQPDRSQMVWSGAIVTNVADRQGKIQELVCYITGTTTSQNSKAETWPLRLTIFPSHTPKTDDAGLRAILMPRNPMFLTLTPTPNSLNGPATNTAMYNLLGKSILMRQTHTVSAWTATDGQKYNALFFLNKEKIIAAVFGNTPTPSLPTMSAEQALQRAASLPAHQKIQFMQAFKQKMDMQQMQGREVAPQQQQQGGIPMNFGLMRGGPGNPVQPPGGMNSPFAGNGGFAFNGMNAAMQGGQMQHNPQMNQLGMLNAMGANLPQPGMFGGMVPQGQNVIQRNPNMGL